MIKEQALIGLWLAGSVTTLVQADLSSTFNFPDAKAQDNKAQPIKPKNNCKGDATTPASAREYAYCLAKRKHGWRGAELVALNNLWTWESRFDYEADNPTSHAYGIPQCMTNLHSACNTERYFEDARYQVRWGLAYLDIKYDRPSVAWAKHQARCPTSLGCWY